MDTQVRTVTAPRQAWAPWNAQHYGPRFCYPLAEAAALIGHTPAQVLALLADRYDREAAGRPTDWEIPTPVPPPPGGVDDAAAAWAAWRQRGEITPTGQPAWVRGRWLMWAWQMGFHDYDGQPVIGIRGLAARTGRRAQSLRKVGLAGPDNPHGLPRPVLPPTGSPRYAPTRAGR
jgi:hypothetical protein